MTVRARFRRLTALALVAAAPLLAGCDALMPRADGRPDSARDFPAADRPVAATVSSQWSTEEARDEVNEAEAIMDAAGVRSGMTVADIGAGEGYYMVRLAQRVGRDGRVLAQDIQRDVISRLVDRLARERLDNVSVVLGMTDDPRLPEASFDRIFMVRMYHEISEPYAFLWRLYPALRSGGEIVVGDANRPTNERGTPIRLLVCEFESIGFVPISFKEIPDVDGYIARFGRGPARREPADIAPCKNG